MNLTGWGRYPIISSNVLYPINAEDVLKNISNNLHGKLIARGLGRSYGDSSLANNVISTKNLKHFFNFDETSGTLSCSAGVSFSNILENLVPKGWFPLVTPGSKFVSVGGAIASDIHGKNHHLQGTFTNHLESFIIATVSDGIIECSRNYNSKLFYATCGGMGLTGIILKATFKLRPIKSSYIKETIIKAKNLEEIFYHFDNNKKATYSVAWIDCLSSGKSLGKSLLILGEHADKGKLKIGKIRKLTIPTNMPNFLLNRYSIKAFNYLYYNRFVKDRLERFIHYDSFFYPLDNINKWYRIYGKNGFTQYQFVLPKNKSFDGIKKVLEIISSSKHSSFLAVLKAFGKVNDNYLSFPLEGYTLALDFKIEKELFNFLNELDKIVLDHDGRIYLAKDVRMSESMFKNTYPKWKNFMKIRKEYSADKVLNSLQSQRIGL